MPKYVCLDVETTSLDPELGALWEVATSVYDTARPEDGDQESWWQVRPNLVGADPMSVQVGRYYERAVVTAKAVGEGVQFACADAVPDECGDVYPKNVYGRPAKKGDWIGSRTGKTIALALAKQLNGAIIVANNPAFDRRFIAKFLRENGQILTASHRMEDIRAMLTGHVYGRLRGRKVTEEFDAAAAPYVQDWLDGATKTLAWEVVGVHQDEDTKHTALGDTRLVRDVFKAITGGTKS